MYADKDNIFTRYEYRYNNKLIQNYKILCLFHSSPSITQVQHRTAIPSAGVA